MITLWALVANPARHYVTLRRHFPILRDANLA